ncbi:hypothetical protein ABQG71_10925 [Bacillus altitudinis]|uniref:Uncharacterized protein n=1 Tax=Bacillus altitudinis TaxID=293387 RepID=A0ABV1S6F7_BACAB
MNEKPMKSTPAATEADSKLFKCVGISSYEIKQRTIGELDVTSVPQSTLNVEFLFISKNLGVEKYNQFLKDLKKFIDEQNQS